MAEVSEVVIVNGVPTGPSGEVPTLAPVRNHLATLIAKDFSTETTLAALLDYFETLDTAAPVPIESHGFNEVAVPTVTAGAYSAGEIMGGLLTFTVAAANDKKVIVNGLQVMFKVSVMPNPLIVHLFEADPTSTTKTDNAAYSLDGADAFKLRESVNFQGRGMVHTDHGTPFSIEIDNLGIVMSPATGTQNIFVLVTDGTGVTLTSTSDMQVRVSGVGVG